MKKFLQKCLHGHLKMLNPIMRYYLIRKKNAIGVIYMLHRVDNINPTALMNNECLKVSPSFLEELIMGYKKKGFVFLSLDQIKDVMESNAHLQYPFVAFTLDDGYIDNYTTAYPIFKKYNVPFCIYVTTDFPDRKAFLWWYALEDFLQERENVTLSNGKLYHLRTHQEKENAFGEIREILLSAPKNEFLWELNNLIVGFDKKPYDYVRKLAMNWEQIIELDHDPLCTIGAHTIHHYAFPQLTEQEIIEEITGCIQILREHIGHQPKHFSYPYGLAYERERKVTEEFPFQTITSCVSDVVKKSDISSFIPRVMLYPREYLNKVAY